MAFCPYNTPWDFLPKACNPFTVNCLLPATWLITASYVDQHKTTSLDGFKTCQPDYDPPQGHG